MTDHLDKSEIEQLSEIMAILPDESEFTEKRKNALTKDDVIIIYRIAKIASTHKCPFSTGELPILHSVASNVSKTQKIASAIIVTGFVTTILGGIWYAIKHIVEEFVRTGGVVK